MRIYSATVVAEDALTVQLSAGFRVVCLQASSTAPGILDLYGFTGTVSGGSTPSPGIGKINTTIASAATVKVGVSSATGQNMHFGSWRCPEGVRDIEFCGDGLWIPGGVGLYVVPSGGSMAVNVFWAEV